MVGGVELGDDLLCRLNEHLPSLCGDRHVSPWLYCDDLGTKNTFDAGVATDQKGDWPAVMYYPIQIPFILSREFLQAVRYTEETVPSLADFVICFWEMRPVSDRPTVVSNIITTDGCIDLVVLYDEKRVGYAGMSSTAFNFMLDMPTRSFGARLRPGVFHQITGLPAQVAMDGFLPLASVAGDSIAEQCLTLPYDQAKAHLRSYLGELTSDQTPSEYVRLSDRLAQAPPASTRELCAMLGLVTNGIAVL